MSDQEKVEEAQKKSGPTAKKFARLIKKGRKGMVKFQAYRKSATFQRRTKKLPKEKRNPKFERKAILREKTFDRYTILKNPCTSERFYKKMENENTIIFYVDQKANKQQIKSAFKAAFGVKPERVNTMNTILGRKKAFIKLPKGSEASEIANKIGLI